MKEALADVPPDRIGGAILVTDGQVHDVPAQAAADLGYPEIDVGVIPAIHFTHLPRVIGRHRAFDLLFTGRTFGAEEAFTIGLASRVVDDGTALVAARALATVLAAKPPRVMRMAREAFMRENDTDHRRGVAAAVENFCNVAATPESRAGIRAFVDRPRRARSGPTR
jgi:enoyl-CoA hydratase/carnithine racemase